MDDFLFDTMKTPRSYVYLPGEGKKIEVAGETITLLAGRDDSNGDWTLMEFEVPPHFSGPPPHWHKAEMEGFYILSGSLTLQIEGVTIEAPAGSFAMIPPATVHTFSNDKAEPVKFLSLLSPAGFEGFVEDLAHMMKQESSWPPADMSRYTALNEKYGMYPPSERPQAIRMYS